MTVVESTRQLDLREKLLTFGAQNLSDTELLAIFISSGTSKKSCVQLAFDLLKHLGDLRAILNADKQSFKKIKGLGEVRYAQLQAVKEMCRRSDFIQLQKEIQITNSKQTYAYLKKRLRDYKNETFAALFLDNQHRIIAYEELFSGTINTATIHPRPIIQRVLQLNAAALILAHNHPSGLSDASYQDVVVTERIREALELVDARLLDHIVIGDNEVYSILGENKSICHE
ncbi:DNA repair protein RadC [Fluoribacter dumoffii]|uniref:DNA repair protein RadC n=1 Tax=Fluoribacter dumoffii TaxID=463 RepID=A0A377G687_9GAMM|nr:DNA repair protein RadC [Fluoribacter dumoffii]KTC92436.1 DNA repair protein RadC [Fluoribacter dumoffii NY 23]MCW8387012.1 DNA repair protein RadC [Fluoribacter dumoffii]MCW8417484.1 DNA repair protein RadC [Fluoribacter dumoffii]MCW8454674.1 DNA repair protein RadC [Fluoribacter dumoffii]MCW8461248.1 DNA repair protein RadC [Fluoribacter dumoffii]